MLRTDDGTGHADDSVCTAHGSKQQRVLGVLMPLTDLLTQYQPGSGLSWDEEEAALRSRICLCCSQPGHYQEQVEAFIAEEGLDQGVCLGDDGRLRDGHHRVMAARRLGIERIPLETVDDAGRRWVRDHGLVNWHGRINGDLDVTEASWIVGLVLKGQA